MSRLWKAPDDRRRLYCRGVAGCHTYARLGKDSRAALYPARAGTATRSFIDMERGDSNRSSHHYLLPSVSDSFSYMHSEHPYSPLQYLTLDKQVFSTESHIDGATSQHLLVLDEHSIIYLV